ncbi:MAG: hypothetical protein ACKO34_03510 [Vampirovibrionales bacterium]
MIRCSIPYAVGAILLLSLASIAVAVEVTLPPPASCPLAPQLEPRPLSEAEAMKEVQEPWVERDDLPQQEADSPPALEILTPLTVLQTPILSHPLEPEIDAAVKHLELPTVQLRPRFSATVQAPSVGETRSATTDTTTPLATIHTPLSLTQALKATTRVSHQESYQAIQDRLLEVKRRQLKQLARPTVAVGLNTGMAQQGLSQTTLANPNNPLSTARISLGNPQTEFNASANIRAGFTLWDSGRQQYQRTQLEHSSQRQRLSSLIEERRLLAETTAVFASAYAVQQQQHRLQQQQRLLEEERHTLQVLITTTHEPYSVETLPVQATPAQGLQPLPASPSSPTLLDTPINTPVDASQKTDRLPNPEATTATTAETSNSLPSPQPQIVRYQNTPELQTVRSLLQERLQHIAQQEQQVKQHLTQQHLALQGALDQLEVYTFLPLQAKYTTLAVSPLPPSLLARLTTETNALLTPTQKLVQEELELKKAQLRWLQKQRFAPEVQAITTLNFAGANPNNPASALGQLRPTNLNTGLNVTLPVLHGTSQRLDEQQAQLELEALRLKQQQAETEAKRQRLRWKQQIKQQQTPVVFPPETQLQRAKQSWQQALLTLQTWQHQPQRLMASAVQATLSQLHQAAQVWDEALQTEASIDQTTLELWQSVLLHTDMPLNP